MAFGWNSANGSPVVAGPDIQPFSMGHFTGGGEEGRERGERRDGRGLAERHCGYSIENGTN